MPLSSRGPGFTRRDLLAGGAGAALSLALGSTACAEPGRKPNIVLIVADDLGYGELGIQGCKDIPTPNIDAIAAGGVRFTDGYVSCPVCSPTRAGLMTGRYQQRFGHEFNPGPAEAADSAFGLAADEQTLAERLKEAGYATCMVGKWHLGYRPECRPTRRGFDEFFGFLGGAHPYVAARLAGAQIMRGDEVVTERQYLTDAFAREAVAAVDQHRDHPFFLYLPFNAVHAPLQAPPRYQQRFAAIQDPKRRTFAAMQAAMDDAVGRVLDRLREHGLERDTLLFFISDNGGPTAQTSSGNGPLRGFKAQVLEGGIRVPFMVRWPGRLPEGKVYDKPVISLDIHATALAAAGIRKKPEKPLDGVNLLPALSGKGGREPHKALFWRFGAQSAVRMGDWKMVEQQGETRLYNLKDDIHEDRDLSADNPRKLKELQKAYEAWDRQLAEPRWGAQGRARRALRR